MSDCIERDAVVSLIEEQQKALCHAGLFSRHSVYGSDRDKFDAWGEIIDAIQAIPTIDPVKRGRWIYRGGTGTCSSCGFIRSLADLAWSYCPNCGAKMDL